MQKNGLRSFDAARTEKLVMLKSIEDKTYKRGDRYTVDEFWQKYSKIKYESGDWRVTTYRNQVNMYNSHLKQKWGGYKLDEVRRFDFQEWISEYIPKHNLSRAMSKSIVSVFKAMFSTAMMDDIIMKNPIMRISTNGKEPKDKSMTQDEYKQITDYIFHSPALSDRNRALAVLALHGLRRGEIAGIKLKDIQDGKIGVFGQVNRYGDYSETKTDAGNRWVPLMPGAQEILNKAVIAARHKAARMQGKNLGPDDFIFLNSSGTPLKPWTITNMFTEISDDLGIKVYPHKLRHAFATFVFSIPGINPKDVMHILGHSNIDMSMYYNTGTEEGKAQTMEQFGKSMLN